MVKTCFVYKTVKENLKVLFNLTDYVLEGSDGTPFAGANLLC